MIIVYHKLVQIVPRQSVKSQVATKKDFNAEFTKAKKLRSKIANRKQKITGTE